MGTKITFEPVNREFVVTVAPVNGVVEINAQVDLYSDAKEDWLTDPTLNEMRFPITPIGGNPFGSLTIGESYLITDGWKFAPYEADHTMRIVGNVGTEAGWELVQDTVGAYRVRVENEVSAIVELRETGVSGLTSQESQALIDIDTNVDTLTTDVATLLAAQDLTNEQAAARHTTSRSTGKVILRNATAMRRWEADAWEDEARSVPYGTNDDKGIEVVDDLVEVAWS